MNAKEMFEGLEGVFSVDIETSHSVGYANYDDTKVTLHYVDSIKIIWFDGFDETVHSDKIKVEELPAITQLTKELGWLK